MPLSAIILYFMISDPTTVTLFHGTIYKITAWRLPTPDERNARGPAGICLTPDFEVAKGYCNAGDGGTEEIARLIPALNAADADRVLDFGRADKPHTARYTELKDRLDTLEADWRAGRSHVSERVYRSTLMPRNPLRIDAQGRKFHNLTGEARRDRTIWDCAKRAQAEGYDCLIVDNVIDNGALGVERPGTTFIVFDPSILSVPELVAEEALTYAEVCTRTAKRLSA